MTQEITSEEGLKILTRQIPPILLAAITGLTALNPVWGVLFATAVGFIGIWGDFGQSRVNEVVEVISEHEREFNPEILKTDKFKAVFLNVLEASMKETMAEKRRLYRNYLLNVGKGIEVDFDYHSKLLTVLNLITVEEIRVLENITKAYDEIAATDRRGEMLPPTAEGLCRKLNQMGKDYVGIAGARKIDLNMRLLQTYNLILTIPAAESETNMRSSALESVTDFGRKFIAFISEPETAAVE